MDDVSRRKLFSSGSFSSSFVGKENVRCLDIDSRSLISLAFRAETILNAGALGMYALYSGKYS
jgi:hypothetical protein